MGLRYDSCRLYAVGEILLMDGDLSVFRFLGKDSR